MIEAEGHCVRLPHRLHGHLLTASIRSGPHEEQYETKQNGDRQRYYRQPDVKTENAFLRLDGPLFELDPDRGLLANHAFHLADVLFEVLVGLLEHLQLVLERSVLGELALQVGLLRPGLGELLPGEEQRVLGGEERGSKLFLSKVTPFPQLRFANGVQLTLS